MNLFWPKKRESYSSFGSYVTTDPKKYESNTLQTEFTPTFNESGSNMTFEDHKDAITIASRALDAALRAAKTDGYAVKLDVVDPMNTSRDRYVFVCLTAGC